MFNPRTEQFAWQPYSTGSMSKSLAVSLLLLAAALHSAAHATPQQDEIDKLLSQKGLVARLGDTIQQATDRASQLVSHAMANLGVPYRLGGTSAETGFDCSGFVRAMYEKTVGLVLPRTAAEQAAATSRIDKADLQPGDLVFFNTLRRANSHVGIYVGEGKFIHSPRSGSTVRVESMNVSYWQRRFDGARRVLVTDANAPTNSALPRLLDRESPAPRAVRLGGTFSKPAQPPVDAENLQPAAGDRI